LKVALVCDWYHPRVGGIERHLQDLAAALVAARHEVVVITPTPGDDLVDGIRVRRISAPRAPRFGFLVTPAGVRAVGDALVSERVDVAHCHVSIVSPAAMGGAAQSVQRKVPTVVTFHSVVPQTHLLARAARATLGTATWPARFSAVSERVARDVRAISPSDITILANGIDVDSWRMQPAPRSDDTVRLISIMRLNAKKRPLKLVDLMRALKARLPREIRARLCIVGDGPERERLAARITAAGLDGRVTLDSPLTHDELPAAYAAAHLVVAPSVRDASGDRDGLPNVVLEALAAGRAVVASDVAAIGTAVLDGKTGLLVAPGDADALAAAIDRLAAEPPLRHRLATGARALVERDFDLQVCTARLARFLESAYA